MGQEPTIKHAGNFFDLYKRPRSVTGAIAVEDALDKRGLKVGRDFRTLYPNGALAFGVYIRRGVDLPDRINR